MKKILGILLIVFVLIACGEIQNSIDNYEAYKVEFAKSEFKSNNGEFSMLLPTGWYTNEDSVESDTVLYVLETGSTDINDIVAMTVFKLNVIYGSIDSEFDSLVKQTTHLWSNVKLVEKSTIEIGDISAKTALFTFERDKKITQEEVDIFIPINKNQYYYMGLVSDKNENTKKNMAMMLECAKSFKLNK